MEPGLKRFKVALERGAMAPQAQAQTKPMRQLLTAFLVLAVFSFGMGASMAQQLKQMDPGTIQINPPPQPSAMQMQTQPAPVPNLNTSKNPYDRKRYLETPSQQK